MHESQTSEHHEHPRHTTGFLGLACAGLLGCTDPDDAPAMQLREGGIGRVTQLCGHDVPFPANLVAVSGAGCEGLCWASEDGGGGCHDPVDVSSRVDVYGCAGKTSESGYSCGADHNGGVLLASFDDGEWHDILDFVDQTDYCTFEFDVMLQDVETPVDYLVWERESCEAACECPYGTDYLGNPVTGTECGQIVCGVGYQTYRCGTSGWEFIGDDCPAPEPCHLCPPLDDVLGNPVIGASCGERVCGAGNTYYLCNDGEWFLDGGACGPSCSTGECPCSDTVIVEGQADLVEQLWRDTGIMVNAGQTVTITCDAESGTIRWGGFGTESTCDGAPFGPVDTWTEAIAPGCQVFSLVAKIGDDGAPHCIDMGSSFVATRSGPLYLAFNDGDVASDNGGAWTVDVALECGGGDPNDPCVTGSASEGHEVYVDTIVGKNAFEAALVSNTATHGITCFEVRGAEFDLSRADLRGVEFSERVHGVMFFGADLEGARFSGMVRRSAFLYANLESADFDEATLVRDDFAFTQSTLGASWPVSAVNTVWTSEDSQAMLPHVPVDQNVIDAVLAGDPDYDGLLGRAWRGYIWDQWLDSDGSDTDPAKARVFDAVDQRYGPWGTDEVPRPAGGPTLAYLHDNVPEVAGFIEVALDNLARSDEPAYLDDPLIGRVSPHYFREICKVERGNPDDENAAANWYAALFNHHFEWNSATPTRNASEVALSPTLLGHIPVYIPKNMSSALDAFNARASDSLFSLGELQADGELDTDDAAIIAAAYGVFVVWCPYFE